MSTPSEFTLSMPPVTDVSRHLTFHRSFLPAWDRNANTDGVKCGDTVFTWGEHRDRVLRLVNALKTELGLTRSSRFAVLALNSADYLACYHAAYLGGGIINPLNIRLAAPEIKFILEDSGTEAIFVDATFAPLVEAIRDSVETLRHVILIGPEPDGDIRIDRRFDDLIAAGEPIVPPETDESTPACLMYTGGTTGLPKGVVHTQRSHSLATMVMERAGIPLDSSRVYIIAAPMFHAATQPGVTYAPLVPCQVVILPMYSPGAFLDTVETHGCTDTLIVPTMVRMFLEDPGFTSERMATFRTLTYGGSPMPEAVQRMALEQLPGCELVQGYGMTEGLPLTILSDADHRAGGERLRSAGRVVPGVDVSIQDPDGTILAIGETGEICCRSGHYLQEYWHRPEETERALGGGWYRSGDVGYLDEDAYLFIVDRAKDMIVSGGENVYTAEVESAISTHPAVADVAVIGIPSEQWGEAVHAVVVTRDGETVTEDEIVAYARERIAGYKLPRSVDVRSEPLPLSGAGKTLKRALRDPYWEGHERSVN